MITYLVVYSDYPLTLCLQRGRWLRRAEKEARANGQTVAVDWRTSSLEQVNAKTPEVKLWEHPEARARGVAALTSAQAARLRDPARFAAHEARWAAVGNL